ncbi:hypothetical protein Tco_0073357 [Tanacetum coccineum]
MCESIRTQTTSNFRSTFFRVTSSPPPPVHVVNRYVREESVPIKKTDKAAEDGYVGRLLEVVVGGGGGYGQRRRVRSTGKEWWMKKFALVWEVSYGCECDWICIFCVTRMRFGVLVGYWESWQ